MDELNDRPGRRSIRLRDFDYASEGMYFITVCAAGKAWLFGELALDGVALNEFGAIVRREWERTPRLRPNVALDEFVIMPDHFHAILYIHTRGGGLPYVHSRTQQPPVGSPGNRAQLISPSQTVGAIVRGFKAATTTRINTARRTPGLSVWQRNYHEHVIRNEEDLNEKRGYIRSNPQRWLERHVSHDRT